MTDLRLASAVLGCAGLLATGPAAAQATSPPSGPFSIYASASAYFPEDDEDYVQPTITADRDRLHLEARFNYEDRDTASAWVGYNMGVGEELTLELTPMLGIIFGNTSGVAPGYKASLAWRSLTLYSETEYVFDADDSDDSYLYTWSELTVAPSAGWRAGFVVQRTKAYDTEFDIQRGFLMGLALERVDLTGYVLNPDESPVFVLAIGASF